MYKPEPPVVNGNLRSVALRVPEAVRECSGIVVLGRRIKSLAFTTDLSILRNINTDAILAVYPFTPQPIISQALLMAADLPVFAGVGGGLTKGKRVLSLATFTEMQGAIGVVVNTPTEPDTIVSLTQELDIPVVVTAVRWSDNLHRQIEAGAKILNVAAADTTPELVARIRKDYPTIPIIASGGPTDESILRTIEAGANAISWTPPSNKEIFRDIMTNYRENRGYVKKSE